MRVRAGYYSVAISPKDVAIWGSFLGYPNGGVVEIGARKKSARNSHRGNLLCAGGRSQGCDQRVRTARHGISTATVSPGCRCASGQFASFDRRKCKGPLNGPKATGNHCPEGWTMYPFPGPQFKNVNAPGSV